MSLQQTLDRYQQQVESAMDRWLPPADASPERLHEAMRYACLNGGKRVRPALVYASGAALGAELAALDGAAVAVELVHAYSLVHDDLPAMDDDDLRRGRPTCHRAFDDATAILAGDALQALAFQVIAADDALTVTAANRVAMLRMLAEASGSIGMAGGQALDLAAVGHSLTLEQLETMHLHKTGALIRASVKLGVLAAGSEAPQVMHELDNYARCIGLAFQVQDDILDIEGETAIIGKPQGSDDERNKPTYPGLLGLDGAKQTAARLCDEALDSLERVPGDTTTLADLARYIVARDR